MKVQTERNTEITVSDETDSDNEVEFIVHDWRGTEQVHTYLSVAEAVRLANALLVATGVREAAIVEIGVTEDRVRDIVREVLRDTFNN